MSTLYDSLSVPYDAPWISYDGDLIRDYLSLVEQATFVRISEHRPFVRRSLPSPFVRISVQRPFVRRSIPSPFVRLSAQHPFVRIQVG